MSLPALSPQSRGLRVEHLCTDDDGLTVVATSTRRTTRGMPAAH